jgi:hypothetical protein
MASGFSTDTSVREMSDREMSDREMSVRDISVSDIGSQSTDFANADAMGTRWLLPIFVRTDRASGRSLKIRKRNADERNGRRVTPRVARITVCGL